MISFHILSKRFFQKREGLSGARLAPITKKEYRFVVHFFVKIHKVFESIIKLLKFLCSKLIETFFVKEENAVKI